MQQSPSWEANTFRIVTKRPFIEAQGSLSCSQGPSTSPTTSEINPVHVPQRSLFILDHIKSSYNLRPDHQNFVRSVPKKTL